MVFKEKLNQAEVKRVGAEYKQVLEKHGIKVDKLVLFGSYARKNEQPWSDVDFVVVSNYFGKKNSFDELTEVNILANEVTSLIEAHPATPEEYENGDNPWLAEAKKYGKELI